MTIDTARLRALAEAATPGAWTADFLEVRLPDGPLPVVRAPGLPVYQGVADAAYIAAADPPTILAILDHLEAADQRAAENSAALEATTDARDALWRRLQITVRERNHYAAVVEKVRAACDKALAVRIVESSTSQAQDAGLAAVILREALAAAPAEALAEHDAKVRAEAIRSARDGLGVYVGDEDSDWWDGYRNGQRRQNTALGEYADRIEKEAGL